jgi:Peptidase family S41
MNDTKKNPHRIDAAQRGLDYASSYAAATGVTTTKRRSARAARGARLLRGPFLAPGSLSPAERRRTVDATLRLLEGLYAHLPLKRARYAFDPVQRLRILLGQIDALSDAGFHIELADILTRLRDAHTTYQGPRALADANASLPFAIERWQDEREAPHYIVTHVAKSARAKLPAAFAKGVEIEFWNGVPIDVAVQRRSDYVWGGRADTQRAAALETMTLRPLRFGPPPDEQWVIVGYRRVDANGAARGPLLELRLAWNIVQPHRVGRARTAAGKKHAMRLAMNPAAEAMRRAKMLLFAPQALARPQGNAALRDPKQSRLPDVLRANRVPTRHGEITLLRLYSFDVDDQAFIDELLRLLPRLDQSGLVIDLRDNPGGTIWAAERALQLFTPKRIVPTRFSLLATPLARRLATIPGFARQELASWRDSLEDAVRNGELYSRALPITPEAKCNEIGQVYGGPVLLVANSSTYSSGDLFTAGFVDNAIGPYLCVGEATAGGGANVYGYADLRAAFAGTADALPALPEGIELSLAFRRATRSGPSQGLPIEDVGVRVAQPRDRYAMTRRDLLEGNCDLYDHCAQRLAALPRSALDAWLRRSPRALIVTTQGIDQLDVEIDGKALASIAVGEGAETPIELAARARRVQLVGRRQGEVVQQRRFDLRRTEA